MLREVVKFLVMELYNDFPKQKFIVVKLQNDLPFVVS